MKQSLIFIGFLLIFTQVTLGQDDKTWISYTLKLNGNKLQGNSRQLDGYKISMILPIDFSEDSLTLDYLFKTIKNNDIRGEFIGSNSHTSEIKYSIVPYRDSITIFMKTSNGWYPWDRIEIKNKKLIFSYDYWYCPPVTDKDLEVIELCFDYLKDSTNWHKKDDRLCDDDKSDKSWSLFCAIKMASIEKYGEYNHRGAVIQKSRFAIDELYPRHGYSHTLMDFNNDPSIKFEDILEVLTIVRNRVKEELKTYEK